jgi:deazaflavin-dependent oxidoreductase (nitroreductase family)
MSAPHPIAPQKGHLHGLSSPRAINEHSVVDISTHGPKSGATRRIEIRLWHADGRIFLSGRPGKRSWYANLRANPQLTVHVKSGAEGDVEMTARPITDRASDARCCRASRRRTSSTRGSRARPLVELTEV